MIGSSSDESVAQETVKVLEDLGVDYELRVLSSHRNPQGMKDDAAREAYEEHRTKLRNQ